MEEAIACSSGSTFASRMSRSVVAMFTFLLVATGRLGLEPGSVDRHPVAGVLKSRRDAAPWGELALAPLPVPVFPSTRPCGRWRLDAGPQGCMTSGHLTRSTTRTELVVPPLAGLVVHPRRDWLPACRAPRPSRNDPCRTCRESPER